MRVIEKLTLVTYGCYYYIVVGHRVVVRESGVTSIFSFNIIIEPKDFVWAMCTM